MLPFSDWEDESTNPDTGSGDVSLDDVVQHAVSQELEIILDYRSRQPKFSLYGKGAGLQGLQAHLDDD